MSDVQLTISSDVVKPIVEAKIHAAIVQEFGKQEQLMASIVNMALQTKVDSDGKYGRGYSSDKSYIEWVVNKAICGSAQQALTEYVEQNKPKIVAAFKRHLTTKIDDIAAQMVSCFIENTKNQYNVSVAVNVAKKEPRY